MKPKPLLLTGVAFAALLSWLVAADQATDPAAAPADPEVQALNVLFADVAAQQIVIAENQTKIDDKLAAVGEEIRQARIYAGRGGGKAK
jgi:hypothetical protein